MSTENLNLSIENDQLTLYKVSLEGDVDALQALLQADELILDRVLTLTSFNETPLHIAAIRNHLHFSKAILARKPKLAHELDSLRRLPLHLASVEGYVDIVKELLHVNPNHACFARDEEGRIPLHLATMKGRNEVIKELVKICPQSVREKAENGKTILHLCVKYNQLETLKLLLETVKDDDEFVNDSDDHGNTILHLASAFKQVEIAKYLVSNKSMKTKANTLNMNGFTALDVVENAPKDFKSLEIQIILLEAGVQRNKTLREKNDPPITQRCCFFTRKCKFIKTYFEQVVRKLEQARGNILIGATVTATLAYQAGLSPPDNVKGNTNGSGPASPTLEAGPNFLYLAFYKMQKIDPIAGFWYANTMSMILSLIIILLTYSGISFRNKFSSFFLLLLMGFTIVHISQAYYYAVGLYFLDTDPKWRHKYGFAYYALEMVGTGIPNLFYFILILHGLSFLILLVRKIWKRKGSMRSWSRQKISCWSG